MRTITRAAAPLFAAIALPASAQPVVSAPSPSPPPGQVRGVVRYQGGPVADARVTLFDPALAFFAEGRTSASGQYRLSAPPGAYRLGVASRGFDYQEIDVDVESNDQLVRRFDLEPESDPGYWEIIGSTLPEFLDATDIAVLLEDGRIFYCHDTTDPILFDPVTGQKSFPSSSMLDGGCMHGTLLHDGRVLFAGGQEGSDPGSFRNAVRWVKRWTPSIDVWERLPDLQHPMGRWYPGLARLADGSVMVMGGGTRPNAARTETCERFDPANETWRYTGSMLNPSEFTSAALLFTGEVLATWSPPQLYDPIGEQWRPTGDFVQPDRGWPGHSDHSLVVLEDGRALAVGIRGASNQWMAEIYDPPTEVWTVASNPGLLRNQTEVVQLPDGRILVAGGEAKDLNPPVPHVLGIVKWSDLYDPATDVWRRVADMNWFREYHAVTLLLPDGRVATTGGTRIKFQVGPTSADIEAFVPPYLLRGVRPQIKAISATELRRGDPVELEILPATRITDVVLIGTQTTTHWVDGGVPRRLVLQVDQQGTMVQTILPADPNVLPVGHYMLFAMVDDIPSMAKIVVVR